MTGKTEVKFLGRAEERRKMSKKKQGKEITEEDIVFKGKNIVEDVEYDVTIIHGHREIYSISDRFVGIENTYGKWEIDDSGDSNLLNTGDDLKGEDGAFPITVILFKSLSRREEPECVFCRQTREEELKWSVTLGVYFHWACFMKAYKNYEDFPQLIAEEYDMEAWCYSKRKARAFQKWALKESGVDKYLHDFPELPKWKKKRIPPGLYVSYEIDESDLSGGCDWPDIGIASLCVVKEDGSKEVIADIRNYDGNISFTVCDYELGDMNVCSHSKIIEEWLIKAIEIYERMRDSQKDSIRCSTFSS